jgi:hypothetical protein
MAGAALAASLAACGGGGGSAGTTGGTNGGGGGTTTTVATPTLVIDIVDSTGASTSTVATTSTYTAKALAKDGSGAPLADQIVTFTADSSLAKFIPASGTALTGADGIARVQIVPASATAAGAGTLQATATLKGTAVTSNAKAFSVPQGISGDTQTAKVANFVMLLDRSTLSNASTATAKLTVVAVDANNNVVPNAVVNVVTDNNTFFTPGGTTTDSSGIFTGTITNGGDKSNRSVTVSVTINGHTQTSVLQIVGSQISLSVTPAIPSLGASAVLTARLTDATGTGIAGQKLAFVSDLAGISGANPTTDSNGNVAINFTAPNTAGSHVISVTGSGVTSQISVQVGSSVSIPAANIPAGVTPSLSALPNVVAPNTAGSTSNQSQLKFLMIDGSNQPVPNVRVRFEIVSTGLGSFDSTISSGTSTVYTNAAGEATASFIPGTTVSPTDGVSVRACYQATEFSPATQCTNSVIVKLTVAQIGLAISIGDDNTLQSADGTYVKKFVVSVVDAAGRAVAGAPVDISLDITHYGKGDYLYGGTAIYEYLDSTGTPVSTLSGLTLVPSSLTGFYPSDPTTDPTAFKSRVWCRNEDLNRNGIVDAGENINGSVDSFGQPVLEPRRSDIVLSYVDPSSPKTDASGLIQIQVQYSQRFATWLAYRIRVSTSVAGSQGSAERLFVTDAAQADASNGSFRTPPYGTGSCSSPN